MWALFITTIFTSATDSLNPFAITQQFVLQGMVKNPKHIWYFILPTGITNLAGGYLAYYGLVGVLGTFFTTIIEKHGPLLFTAELILGIGFLIGTYMIFKKSRMKKRKKETTPIKDGEAQEQEEVAGKIKSVSPMALVALGVGATISELATALPYFAFIAVLLNYSLTLFQLSFILIVYNTIYMLPLMVLYFVYIKAQDRFDRLYQIIKSAIAKGANMLGPVLTGIIGVALVYHAASLLLI